jgi:4-hydroxy-3-methylbut-2-enyl diphosphate reductase
VEVAERSGARSHLIQSVDEVEPAWLAGVDCVGVTAGASSPEFLVEQLVAHLLAHGGEGSSVSSLDEVDEGVTFKLPPELLGPSK